MEPYVNPNIALLGRNHRFITRHRDRQIRRTFPFMKLPVEIRNIIYDFSINVSGIQNILDRYYRKLQKSSEPRTVKGPLMHVTTQHIFLINKEIYAEALLHLRRRSITFDHGFLDLLDLTDFANKNVFRTVSCISITDDGHGIIRDEGLIGISWHGYMKLIEQLSLILSTDCTTGARPNLQYFTIKFNDPKLAEHVARCWNARFRCGYRDTLRDALRHLRRIRGVKCVTLHGLPPALACDLKAHMESEPCNFLDLPRELRNMVYGFCADWSDASKSLVHTVAGWTDVTKPLPYPKMSTPTIFLINKQITMEASEVIHKKPLNLILSGSHNIRKTTQAPIILRFISRRSLEKVRELSIYVGDWPWMDSLENFLTVLAVVHNLKSLLFYFKGCLRPRILSTWSAYPDRMLHTCLSHLAHIRGLDEVILTGDLPLCYTAPLARIMQTVADALVCPPKILALRADGSMIELVRTRDH